MQTAAEVEMAASWGADFVGLVGAMPSGPGPIPDEAIGEIAAQAPTRVTPVLLSSREDASGLVAHVQATGVPAVQLVRTVAPAVRHALRQALPGLVVFQVVHVEGPASVGHAVKAAEGSDYLLLDSGRPSATTPELGGTGRVHDWSVSAEIVARSPVPVFLAGGLRPDNVADAVAAVAPYGVDVCTGLRDGRGRLEREKLAAFMTAIGHTVREGLEP